MFPRRAGLWSGLITPVVWPALILGTRDIINLTMKAHIQWTWFVASQVAFGLVAIALLALREWLLRRQTQFPKRNPIARQ